MEGVAGAGGTGSCEYSTGLECRQAGGGRHFAGAPEDRESP